MFGNDHLLRRSDLRISASFAPKGHGNIRVRACFFVDHVRRMHGGTHATSSLCRKFCVLSKPHSSSIGDPRWCIYVVRNTPWPPLRHRCILTIVHKFPGMDQSASFMLMLVNGPFRSCPTVIRRLQRKKSQSPCFLPNLICISGSFLLFPSPTSRSRRYTTGVIRNHCTDTL